MSKRHLIATIVATAVLAGGGAALAAQGHPTGRAHQGVRLRHISADTPADQCVAAKQAGSPSAVVACAAANDAANPPLTSAQLTRMRTLGQECLAAKAISGSDRSACAEANAVAGG